MKKKMLSALCALILALSATVMTGCGSDGQKDNSQTPGSASQEEGAQDSNVLTATEADTSYPLTITDDLGNTVTIEKEPERILSLSPANTETLFALDGGKRLVGRTDYCSYPKEAADIPSIGTYTSPNTELIISMSPDVIFASDYIDDNIRAQVEQAGAKVLVFAANDMASVQQDILKAGQVLNTNKEAKNIVEHMDAEMAELKQILSKRSDDVSAFIDLGSYYSAGADSLLGNMLEDIGVKNVAADTGEAWPQLSVEKIIEYDPDIYISLFTTPEELKQVSGLSSLDCIKNDKILFFEALSAEGDLIQRAGPRLAEGTKLLAQKIYPELFS